MEKCQLLGYEIVGFLDDTLEPGETINGVSVLGGFNLTADDHFGDDVHFHVAIGDPARRVAEYQRLKSDNRKLATIIHPKAAGISCFTSAIPPTSGVTLAF